MFERNDAKALKNKNLCTEEGDIDMYIYSSEQIKKVDELAEERGMPPPS